MAWTEQEWQRDWRVTDRCTRRGHTLERLYETNMIICQQCDKKPKEETQIEGNTGMNYSTAILVMNPDARCVKVIYEPDTLHTKAPRELFKTFDKTIKVDDFVVVPSSTRHNITTCKVVEVDVDDWMDTGKSIGWVIGRIDLADAEKVKNWEATAIEALKDAEKRKRRREMQASMTEAMNEKEKEGLALMLASPLSADEAVVVDAPKAEVA